MPSKFSRTGGGGGGTPGKKENVVDTSTLAPGWQKRWGYPIDANEVSNEWEPTEKTYDPQRKGFVTKFNSRYSNFFTPKSIQAVDGNKDILDKYPTLTSGEFLDDNYATTQKNLRGMFNHNDKNYNLDSLQAGYMDLSRIIPGSTEGGRINPIQAQVFTKDIEPLKLDVNTAPLTSVSAGTPAGLAPLPPKRKYEPFSGSTSATDIGVSKKGMIWSGDSKTRKTRFSR